MVSSHEALRIILSSVGTMEREVADLRRSHGRVLAENILSSVDIPPFDNSAMDGFAVWSEDLENPPVVLTVVDEVSAGRISSHILQRGEAIRIMTGASIPAGANAVVQVEWTETLAKNLVRIVRAVSAGQNIRRAGEDIQKGQLVLEAGCELRAAELGILASLGRPTLAVYRRPGVAILATGNELLEPDKPLEGGKIRNSNTYTLYALVEEVGALPVDLGIVKDDEAKLRSGILQGLESDAVVTSGGVSVGEYDLVRNVMEGIGVEMKFWKVNIKPGMPLFFGLHNGKPLFGLPGNPVSTMVTFLQFVRPALRKMMGVRSEKGEVRLRAQLMQEITKTDRKRHFIRGVLESQNGALTVKTTGSQSSGVLTSLVSANCLIIIPEEVESLKSGDVVEVELL